MTTEEQIQANRENAQLGGVKTPEGKAITRFNAIQHGILRQSLTEYEKELYPSLLDELVEELKPVGILETILVERVALCYLRLFRVAKSEREFLQSKLHPRITRNPVIDDLIKGYGEEVVEEGYTPKIDVSIIRELDHTLLRYETTIERSLFKALHELQRLQAVRLGQKIPLPLAIDVNVNKELDE